MSRWACEIVRDFDNTYYANMCIEKNDVKGLPEYVDYNTLKKAIEFKTGIVIPRCKDLIFERLGRKYYAFIDVTQARNDCRVTLEERINGYKPNFE